MSGVIILPPFLMVVFWCVIQLSYLTEELVDKFIEEETAEMLARYFLIIMGVWAVYLALAPTVKKMLTDFKKVMPDGMDVTRRVRGAEREGLGAVRNCS